MISEEHDSDKSLKLRNKQIDNVRKILVRNGYSAQLLRDAMEDVTSHVMGTPEKASLQHTIETKMSKKIKAML